VGAEAHAQGLRVGCRLQAVGGAPAATPAELTAAMDRHAEGPDGNVGPAMLQVRFHDPRRLATAAAEKAQVAAALYRVAAERAAEDAAVAAKAWGAGRSGSIIERGGVILSGVRCAALGWPGTHKGRGA